MAVNLISFQVKYLKFLNFLIGILEDSSNNGNKIPKVPS